MALAPASAGAVGPSPLKPPKVIVAGIPAHFEIEPAASLDSSFTLEITRDGTLIASHAAYPEPLPDITLPRAGVYTVKVRGGGETWISSARALPGLVTTLPPVLAIVMALVFRQVVIALFAGIWLGAFLVNDFHALRSFFYVVDHYAIQSLAGEGGKEHVSIAVFTLFLGGMVGVFSRIGGTQGVVNEISRLATSARRGQLATWLMGIAIFFDDYTNTLVVGSTMRPVTDRLKISREKLSYIVDSTAAPVAVVAVITSWIGFEIGLIKDAFDAMGTDRNPFTTFIASIPYSFYPILTLLFGLFVAVSGRDFGPMLQAERRARRTGRVIAEKAVPLSSLGDEIPLASSHAPRWFNAAIPVVVVILGTFLGLVLTGRSALVAAGVSRYSILDVLRESDSFVALLWSSLAGCVAAIALGLVQRLATLTEMMMAWVTGVKSMVAAIVILVLAWSIGAVCDDLHTAQYLVAKVSGVLSPSLLPSIVFVIAAAVSFATGTSWGTMTILTPITIPLVVRVAEIGALAPGAQEVILLSSISAVLAGSVFGDHCSPISDTTIMSSMASGADHIDHVRTQLPYAVAVAVVSVVLGYLPVGYDVPVAVAIIMGVAGVVGIILAFGRSHTPHAQ
jgi:Na+/H+ antiporter NhaC